MEPVYPALSSDVDVQNPITVPALINGTDVLFSSNFDVIGPHTGGIVWKCTSASPQDAIRAVEAAEAAFPIWSSTNPTERRRILLKAADLMEERVPEIATTMITEMGADRGSALDFVTPLGVTMCRDIAARTTSLEGRITSTEVDGQTATIQKIPIGVCLGVVTWNAPAVFATRSIATALAAGCTTVIKAHEFTPRCYYLLTKCFVDAGVPPGAVNVISCKAEDAAAVTTAMIEHPAVRKINFTGSADIGRKLAVTCAQNLKPCLMELGGKNSAIVLEDANLENAAIQCILGGLLNSGQICMATDRIIVQSKVAQQFKTTFSGILGKMFPGTNPPATVSHAAAKNRIEEIVAEAEKSGAKIVEGDWNLVAESNASNAYTNGVFLRPIVVEDVKPAMRIWQEEIFGSVVAMTTVETEEEAVALANDTRYGLNAAVFTEDIRRGIRVSKRIDVGQVNINRMTVQGVPALPFGGVKSSGWGRFNHQEGLDEFLTTKVITWMD
ncbi:hypothetical protein TWF694_005994 [Orbilia ellipsospora]|uniref:Aldehyde dehydrogenase domain-containing protein n=1 Tax=Orbilia ellipsospora TaxID=2528407 RepID=A0AAV9WWZ3_9PEZI